MFDPWFTAWACADALAVQRSPPWAWRRRRHERLQALVAEALRRSPAWRRRLQGARLDAPDADALLHSLPVTRKAELMAGFDGWVTDPALTLDGLRAFAAREGGSGRAFDGRVLVWESSGSSGVPGLFVQDAGSLAVSDALQALRGPASRPGAAGVRTAFVGAIDGPFASIVSLQRLRRLNPWVAALTRAFSFLQPVEALVAELQGWRPEVVATYPSMAWVLAGQAQAGALRLPLRAVWTGGESLGRARRDEISRRLGCPVIDSYGASECLDIAAECGLGAMHLNADWVILEPVDARLRPVPEGEAGQSVLLTNLANHVQPILRYDLGDRVRLLPGACACGSPLPVIEVGGRRDELLSMPGAHGRPVDLSPLAITTVLEERAGLFDFRLVQLGAAQLRLELAGIPASDARARRAAGVLGDWLRAQGVASPRIACVPSPAPPARGRSGKQPRVQALRREGSHDVDGAAARAGCGSAAP